MSGLHATGHTIAAVAVVIAVVGASGAVMPAAQTRDGEATAQTQALRELVVEVRALRAVIEKELGSQV